MNKSDIARLFLVDDHRLVLDGLRELASHWPEFQVVGEASNGKDAVELCRECLPDIVLMDIQMPVLNGVEAARIIHNEFPEISVVMLTMSEDEKDLFESLKQGAQGYILKNISAQQLRERLHEVLAGEAPLSGAIASKILVEFNRLSASEASGQPEVLTEREIQILQLVAEGQTNSEIGLKLHLSEQTVKKQLSLVMRKLHLNNRVQAAAYAIRKGLTE